MDFDVGSDTGMGTLGEETPFQFIIEGVDRLGKSTLIENLLQELGYRLVIHYEKPRPLKFYKDDEKPLLAYMEDLYSEMFELVSMSAKVIFDRGHLGEVVYAPMYRKYSGNYVYELEQQAFTDECRLILLTTSDFSFIKDDGLSLDFSKKEEEQAKFIAAFHASNITDKRIVDVCNGKGGYRSPAEILAEVLAPAK